VIGYRALVEAANPLRDTPARHGQSALCGRGSQLGIRSPTRHQVSN